MGGIQQSDGEKKSRGDGAVNTDSAIMSTINDEILALYNYLEKHNVSGSEMNRLIQPLVDAVEGGVGGSQAMTKEGASAQPPKGGTGPPIEGALQRIARWRPSRLEVVAITCLLLALFGYSAVHVPSVNRVMTVAGRHLLLLLLPYWDWTKIYYADCMVSNPFYVSHTLTASDCNICESLESIDVLSDVAVSVATDEYLRNDRPFVVTDAMTDWPVMNTDDFWFDNITEVYRTGDMTEVYPCELTSNLRLRPDDLQSFLRRIHMPAVDRWYGHWENCDKKGAKVLRSIYQRPYFMPQMVDFSDTNWVLMSSDYKAKVYKEVRFQSEVLWMAAVRGWWHVRAVPREPCNEHCPELIATLTEGQMLVVTNLLWKLEYIPGEETDNLGIAVGGFWN